MAEDPALTAGAADVESTIVTALIDILRSANSPSIQRARELIAYRLAITGDVAPSRIPPPRDITQVGGYLNLLTDLDETQLRARTMAAALGVAGPDVALPPPGTGPSLFFATRVQPRPEGPQQATLPLSFTVRSDFAAALDAMLATITEFGCTVPLLSPAPVLPTADIPPPDTAAGQLALIGRTLRLAPTAALHDPATDPLGVSRPLAGGDFEVVALQLDTSAPQADSFTAQDWVSWRCDETECAEEETQDVRLPLRPILNSAGWYSDDVLEQPLTVLAPGNWANWRNITSLVPGQSTYGDELRALYPPDAIVASSVREVQTATWDGARFT